MPAITIKCKCGCPDLKHIATTHFDTWILECQECRCLAHYDLASGYIQWYQPPPITRVEEVSV